MLALLLPFAAALLTQEARGQEARLLPALLRVAPANGFHVSPMQRAQRSGQPLAMADGPPLVVPTSPENMVASAATAVESAVRAGYKRLVVNLVIPTDPVFDKPEDLDPWPGGLKQQYPIALPLVRQMLQRAVLGGVGAEGVRDQVVDAEDACGLLMVQAAQPLDDAVCLLFPGTDQLGTLEQVQQMAGPERLVVLVNPQFRRLGDFSPLGGQRARAQKAFFDAGFETAYSFEEFACRGEDVKLVGSKTVGWRAFVFLDDADSRGTPLFDGATLAERPEYDALEKEINRAHPSPRWARKLNEVDEKGLRFTRRE